MKRAVSLFFVFLFTAVIWAQNRYALVIGNANYQDSALPKLPNTINDAQDISEALDKLGYKVVLKNDLNQIAMTREITDFIARLRAGGQNSEGFFWFGGHGIMLDGINYLLPVTANTERDDVVIATSYSFNRLLDQLSNLRNKANVLVLDACRTPPPTAETTRDAYSEITRRVQRVSNVPSDLFIMYSTKAGSVAYEGAGKRNSPFTEAFLNNIMSAEPLVLMVSDIVKDTITKTEGRQQPDYQGSIPNDKYYSLNTAGVVTPTMVRIEGGTFTMGSPANEPERWDDEVQHRVTVSTFYMSKYEVTQAEYESVMETNPSYFKGANLPVENVSWYNAVEYCNALSQREGLTPAYTIDKSRSDPNNKSENDRIKWLVTRNPNANGYRLPTEAEWEYACRAGTTTPFNTGNNITTNQANYDGYGPYNNNAKGTHREETTPVGSFAANQWDLHDMHGNVWEWCWDWYDDYTSGTQTNPPGAVSGAYRVLRGGSWYDIAGYVRSAHRRDDDSVYGNYGIGFRLVRNYQ